MTITHHHIEAYLSRKDHGYVQLDPALESAVKLGILIELVADALNSEAVLQKLRDDVTRFEGIPVLTAEEMSNLKPL